MSQVSYGTITITDTTDIERIYTVYAKSANNATVPSIAKESWSENVSTAPGTGNYIWQRTVVEKSGTGDKAYSDPVCLTGEEGTDATEISGIEVRYGISADWNTQPSSWSADTPAYDSSKPKYWTRTRLIYDTNPATYSDPVYTKDEALTKAVSDAAIANSIATHANEDAQGAMSQAAAAQQQVTQIDTLLGGHFLWHGSALSQNTKSGARIVEQTTKSGIDVSANPAQWLHNVNIGANGIQLRYNEAVLAQLAATNLDSSDDIALKFYQPPTISGNTTTQGNLTMALKGNALTFYNPTVANGQSVQATLDANGLKLLKGGIEAGTFNSNDYIYVWSNDDNNHAIKIGNSSNNKNDWRIIAGNKFGVDKAGNLYANNADITGAITATSLTIGSGANSYDGAAAINISGYSIEIELSNTGVSDTTSQVYLIPHLYHNGIEDTTNVVYTRYMWYRNDESIGTVGSSVDGGILAYRNSVYRVNYQFDDGEVGSGTPVQTIEVNPTKYITDINNSGIKVHAQDWDDDSNYLQIDGNGVYIKDSNNENLGIYSYYTQIGRSDEAHIEIKNGNITLCNEYSVPIIQMLPGSGNLKTCYESGEGQWANRGGSSSVTYRTVRIQLPTIDLSIDNLVIVFNYTIDSSQTVNFTFSNYGTQTVSGVTAIYSNNEVIINVPTSEEGRYWYRCSYKVYSGIPKFIMGTVSTEVADWSFIVGDNVEATGSHSFAIGQGLKTTGINSIALGTSAHAIGDYSFAKGGFANYISTDDSPYAVARGMCSHAEGSYVEANGNCSYAFGVYANAYKTGSIAIGENVDAYEENSIAMGEWARAYKIGSIAIGKGVEANKNNQIAFGTYNVRYNTNDIFIIGNGTSNNRSDALTVDSSGNVTIAGTLTQSSDKRLKEHKSYLSTDAIEFIHNLKPAHFVKDNESHVGFYAQDVEKIDEWNCMVGEMNGYKTLGYTEIIAPLVAYCQHLEERVKQLENQ